MITINNKNRLVCPVCDSVEIAYDGVMIDGIDTTLNYLCTDCGSKITLSITETINHSDYPETVIRQRIDGMDIECKLCSRTCKDITTDNTDIYSGIEGDIHCEDFIRREISDNKT